MPEIELGLVLAAYDRTEGALKQLTEDGKKLQDSIVGLGKEMEKGGEAGRQANQVYRDLNRQLDANDKAARLAAKAWADQHDVMMSAVEVGDRVARTFDRGLKMMTQYNVAQIRVTQAQDAQTAAAQRVERATARLLELEAQGKDDSDEYRKGIEELHKAQEDLEKTTQRASQAQDQLNMMMLGFIAQAPAFAKDTFKIVESIKTFQAQVQYAGGLQTVFTGALGNMQAAASGFFSFMLANPLIAILGGIAAAVGLIALAWHTDFMGMRDDIEAFYNENFAPIVNDIMELLKDLWDGVLVPLGEIFKEVWVNVIGPALKWTWDNILKPYLGFIIEGLRTVIGWIRDAIQWIKDLIREWESWQPTPKEMQAIVTGTLGEAGVATILPGTIPEGQVGFPYGVPRTGLYRLHEGEVVGRAGPTIGTVNVYANDYQGGRAAARGLVEELRRMGYV